MVKFRIPAFCPTCGAVFASGVSLREGAIFQAEGVAAGPCPNGHTGLILDGTYSAVTELYAFFSSPDNQPVIEEIKRISERVAQRKTIPEDGLDEMADLLPDNLGAAVKKLGANHPVTALLIILAIIGSLAGGVSKIADVYKSLSPDAPTPPTVIVNNNPTIINQVAPGHEGGNSVSQGPSRQERRHEERQGKTERQSAQPSERQGSEETGSTHVKPPKRPKARTLKRKERAERRRAFNPRPKINPTKDRPS